MGRKPKHVALHDALSYKNEERRTWSTRKFKDIEVHVLEGAPIGGFVLYFPKIHTAWRYNARGKRVKVFEAAERRQLNKTLLPLVLLPLLLGASFLHERSSHIFVQGRCFEPVVVGVDWQPETIPIKLEDIRDDESPLFFKVAWRVCQ